MLPYLMEPTEKESTLSTTSLSPSMMNKLARGISNKQFDEIERLIELSKYSSNICPTCEARAVTVGGTLEWPESFFTLWGKRYFCDCHIQQTLMRHYILAHLPEEYWVLNEKDYYGDPEAWNAMETYLESW